MFYLFIYLFIWIQNVLSYKQYMQKSNNMHYANIIKRI